MNRLRRSVIPGARACFNEVTQTEVLMLSLRRGVIELLLKKQTNKSDPGAEDFPFGEERSE